MERVVVATVTFVTIFISVLLPGSSVGEAKSVNKPTAVKQTSLEETVFKSSCKVGAGPSVYLTATDTCASCQGRADEEIDIVASRGGSACEAYSAGADWCWHNCSPCSFCVRYNRIAAYYCT